MADGFFFSFMASCWEESARALSSFVLVEATGGCTTDPQGSGFFLFFLVSFLAAAVATLALSTGLPVGLRDLLPLILFFNLMVLFMDA
jgi:hypothetical protein